MRSAVGRRALKLARALEKRAAVRRARALERRTSALTAHLLTAPAGPRELAQGDDLTHTLRVAWELLANLRASLLSLEERATRIVPAEVAGLVALWTQIYTFDAGAPRTLAWTAWGTLIVAVLVLARLVMPSRLARFWDTLVPPELVLNDLRPLRPAEEAGIAAHSSATLHAQIDRLRRGFRVTIVLSGVALVLVALAYVLDKS